jgi:hypothetical protein
MSDQEQAGANTDIIKQFLAVQRGEGSEADIAAVTEAIADPSSPLAKWIKDVESWAARSLRAARPKPAGGVTVPREPTTTTVVRTVMAFVDRFERTGALSRKQAEQVTNVAHQHGIDRAGSLRPGAKFSLGALAAVLQELDKLSPGLDLARDQDANQTSR